MVLILLGETLKRRNPWWCGLLMVVLFAEVIVVPELAYLAVTSLLVIVAADYVHRDPVRITLRTFSRTLWCAAIGTVLLGLWFVYLVANHAVSGFVDYYRIFLFDHAVGSAIPPVQISRTSYLMFGAGMGLVLLTFWAVAARIRGRREWTPRDWVTVAAAGLTALFVEKSLGRFDGPHVLIGFTVTAPLALLWLDKGVAVADHLVRRIDARMRGGAKGFLAWRPVSVVALIVVLAASPAVKRNFSMWTLVNSIPGRMHSSAPQEPTVPYLGYATSAAVDTDLINDLRSVLDTYAPNNAPIFDMTNSEGYLYYLLQRVPATKLNHIDTVKRPITQRLVIDDLKRTRPPIVVFDSTEIGLPAWDPGGIRVNVRSYDVSQYVLHGWVPLLQRHGELLLLRRDLMQNRPSLPALSSPAQTSDLYFSRPTCAWGSAPNFLSSQPTGRRVDLPVTSGASGRQVSVSGWVVYGNSSDPARRVVIVSQGRAVATAPVETARPDIAALLGRSATNSGFALSAFDPGGTGPVSVMALTDDGALHPIGGPASDSRPVRTADGSVLFVGAPIPGHVDSLSVQSGTPRTVTLPAGVALTDYDLLTFHGSDTLGPADLTVTDALDADTNHEITAHALPASGAAFSVRVGACQQWYGYAARTLSVLQSGGSPVRSVTLSGVR